MRAAGATADAGRLRLGQRPAGTCTTDQGEGRDGAGATTVS